MRRESSASVLTLITMGVALTICGCSKDKTTKSPEQKIQTTNSKAGLPVTSVINTGQMFVPASSSLGLSQTVDTSSANCPSGYGGTIAMVIRNSCFLNQIAISLTYGKSLTDANNDGVIGCEELSDETKTDLTASVCDPEVNTKTDVTEATVKGTDGTPRKISIANAGALDAVGAWNKTNGQIFPSLIRLWKDLGATSNPDLAVYSKDASSIEFWSKVSIIMSSGTTPEGRNANRPFKGKLRRVADLSNCKSAPSAETCLSQDISIWHGAPELTDSYQVAPDGTRVRVLADDDANPQFLAVEGMYVISDSNARWGSVNASQNDNSSQTFFENARTIYFQAIRYEGEVWGRLVPRDGQGNIVNGYANFAGAGPLLAAQEGHCINLTPGSTSSDASLASKLSLRDSCEKIDASLSKFTSIWEGEANFTKPSAETVGMPSGL